MTLLQSWYKHLKTFHEEFDQSFGELGFHVALHPYRYLVAGLITALTCASGLVWLKVESASSKLWVPQNSLTKQAQAYMESKYGNPARFASFALLSTTSSSVTTLSHFSTFWNLHDMITDNTSANVINSNGNTWSSMCDGNSYDCVSASPLTFFAFNRTYYDVTVSTESELLAAISASTNPAGFQIPRDRYFGNIGTDSNGNINSASIVVAFYYFIDNDAADDYLLEYVDVMAAQAKTLNGLELLYFTDRSTDDGLADSVTGDIPLMILTYIIMGMFSCAMLVRSYRNFTETRILLSTGGVLIVILGIAAGYGLCAGSGVIFTSIHQVLPFIIVGIGLDDMFIIVATFDSYNEIEDIPTRMSATLRRCGLSITYTTVTDVVAFLIGSISILPAIEYFCLYAAASLFLNYAFQVTMFSALLVLDMRRYSKGKIDCCPCFDAGVSTATISSNGKVHSVSEEVEFKKLSRDDDTNVSTANTAVLSNETATSLESESAEERKRLKESQIVGVLSTQDQNDGDGELEKSVTFQRNLLQKFISEVYYPLLRDPISRIVVVVFALSMLCLSIYGCVNNSIGFDVVDLMSDDWYGRAYIVTLRKYDLFFVDNYVGTYVIYKELEYHTQAVQQEIIAINNNFVDSKYNAPALSTNWLGTFKNYYTTYHSSNVNSDGYMTDYTTFYSVLNTFLATDAYAVFSRDLVLSTNGTGQSYIESSRFGAFHINVWDSNKKIKAMQNARSVLDDSSSISSPVPFSSMYNIAESDLTIIDEMMINLACAISAVILLSLVVLRSLVATSLVALLVIYVDVIIIGFVYLWDLEINTITVVQVIMAVGLVVDYCAHIMHYYLLQKVVDTAIGNDSNNCSRSAISTDANNRKIHDALVEIGPSIILGCFTTFLGVCPLGASSSVIFRIFFKMFVSIILSGALTGLVLLPTVLFSFPIYIPDEDEQGEKKKVDDGVDGVEMVAKTTEEPKSDRLQQALTSSSI